MKINWNGPARVYLIVGIVLALAIICALAGCTNGKVSSKGTKASAPQYAGTPATVATNDSSTGIVVPAGTPIKVTKREAIPAVPATNTSPARPEDPAVYTYEFTPTADTAIKQTVSTTQAVSGTTDTSVAITEIKQKSKDKLLWFAGISVAGALFFVWRAYPTGIMLCGVAAAIFFGLWQLSNLPDWMQFVAFAMVGGSAGIYFTYERKEREAKEAKQNAQNAV